MNATLLSLQHLIRKATHGNANMNFQLWETLAFVGYTHVNFAYPADKAAAEDMKTLQNHI